MENKVFTKSEGFKSEYSCAIVTVPELTPIEGSDFLAKTNIFGTQIVVRRDQVSTGDVMLYAANETQLNERFLSVNNLYEISCREKNANAEEVAKIMSEYEPIKAEADKKRNEAKNIKGMMETYTKKSQKIQKSIKKKEKDAEKLKDKPDEASMLTLDIPELQKKADEYVARAMALTTQYTNLKKEVEDIVKSGEHIVAEAKKHCGFFNKYGRVRCLTLKGCPSFGVLFSPDDLMKFDPTITMDDILGYVGNEFDTVNGELFVKVFVPPVKEQPVRGSKASRAQKKLVRFDRMVEGEFSFHYETSQFQKIIEGFNPTDVVDITVKRHGTSIIIGNLLVKQPIRLPFFQRLLNKFIDLTGLLKSKRIKDWEEVYGPLYSSRTVIKNRYINKEVTDGFYSKDVWSEWGDIVYPYLPEGMTVYGEICGYVTGTQTMIQKTYDYGCEPGENNLMIYRITTKADEEGKKEWEIPDVKAWTEELIERMKSNGDENWKRLHPIDLLYHGTLEDLYPDLDTTEHWHVNLLEKMKNDKEHFGMEENEPMCTHFKSPREGICIRREGDIYPSCSKLKTNSFFIGESVRMDSADVDIEMTEGYSEN